MTANRHHSRQDDARGRPAGVLFDGEINGAIAGAIIGGVARLDTDEDALLGTDTDERVAARIERTHAATANRREALGILPFVKRWASAEDRLLGTMPTRSWRRSWVGAWRRSFGDELRWNRDMSDS